MSETTATVDHSELETLVRRAGEQLLALWPGRRSGHVLKANRKADGSLVTEADFASHEIITAGLHRLFPNDFILSEEDIDAPGFAAAETAWILDPLDGTEIYSRGKNFFSIFLSRRVGQEITEGIMYYPVLGHYLRATKGHGAFCDGERLTVSRGDTTLRPRSVFPVSMSESPHPSWCAPDQYDVSTRALVGLCRGEIDGVVVHFRAGHFYPWDFAPGTLIVEESGGRVTDQDNRPILMRSAAVPARFMIASNGALHQQVLALIPPLDQR